MWYPGSGVVLDVSIPDLCRYLTLTISFMNIHAKLHPLSLIK